MTERSFLQYLSLVRNLGQASTYDECSDESVSDKIDAFGKYAVGPAFQFNAVLRIFLYIEKRHPTLVAGFLTFLYFPMEAASLLHGLPIRSAPVTAVQIANSQHKFYEALY